MWLAHDDTNPQRCIGGRRNDGACRCRDGDSAGLNGWSAMSLPGVLCQVEHRGMDGNFGHQKAPSPDDTLARGQIEKWS